MKREAIGCTKLKRLAVRLGIARYRVVGILESLWWLTAEEAPQGNIGRLSDEDIALGIEYDGDICQLIQILTDERWLDASFEHRLLVHDWPEHADKHTHAWLAKRTLLFANGTLPYVPHDLFNAQSRARLRTQYRERYNLEPSDFPGTQITVRDKSGTSPGQVRDKSGTSPGQVRDKSGTSQVVDNTSVRDKSGTSPGQVRAIPEPEPEPEPVLPAASTVSIPSPLPPTPPPQPPPRPRKRVYQVNPADPAGNGSTIAAIVNGTPLPPRPPEVRDFVVEAVRSGFPDADSKICEAIRQSCRDAVPDASDDEIALAIRRAGDDDSGSQRGPALFVTTAPKKLRELLRHTRGGKLPESPPEEVSAAHEAICSFAARNGIPDVNALSGGEYSALVMRYAEERQGENHAAV